MTKFKQYAVKGGNAKGSTRKTAVQALWHKGLHRVQLERNDL